MVFLNYMRILLFNSIPGFERIRGKKAKEIQNSFLIVVKKPITLNLPSLPFLSVRFSGVKYIHIVVE